MQYVPSMCNETVKVMSSDPWLTASTHALKALPSVAL